jgi:hypothetical protein
MTVVWVLVLGGAGLGVPAPTAAAGPASQTVVDEFENGAWYVADGTAALATTGTKRSGSGALAIDYDVGAKNLSLGLKASPKPLPGLPRALSIDVHGDHSWTVFYLQLRDATGELFKYRFGNVDFDGWKTLTIALASAPPAGSSGGDADGRLDLPIQLHKLNVERNGPTTDGAIVLDALTLGYDDWSPMKPDTHVIVPSAGQATNLRVGLEQPGSIATTLIDAGGRTRTWSVAPGSSDGAAFRFDGRDGGGTAMSGSVRARLDVTWDGAVHRYEVPYLMGLGARPEPRTPGSIVGINSTMTTLGTDARADVEHQAKLMEDAYVRMARESFDWNRVEPRKGWHDWYKFDQAVEIARAHQVDLIGTLGLSAKWASSAPVGSTSYAYYPPKSTADFAAYAKAVVHRYKDRVKVWEIWNEENSSTFWKPGPSASGYAKLLKAAYAAIKAEDPTATVLLGGTVGFDRKFLDGVAAAGAWDAFDALAIHTYVAPQPESSMMETWLGQARAYLAKRGNKPLWLTEFGWSTYSGSGSGYIGVSETKQGDYLSRAYLQAARHGVRGVFAYSLIEYGTSSTSRLHNYGLVEGGGRKKPAYAAVRRVAEALDGGTTMGVAAPNAASRTTIASMDTTTGFKVRALGGGWAAMKASTARHGGNGSIQVDYAFSSSSTGLELIRNLLVAGKPSTVSVWVHGDGSANPVYLKISDKTGESFQASIGSLQAGWQRMTMYMDGADINWKHSGGDGDGVVDYPITVRSLFVYRAGNGVLNGLVHFDDLQVETGPRVRGVVISRRGMVSQALYTLGAGVTAKVPVTGTTAYQVDGPTATTLAISGGTVSVSLGKRPINVLSSPSATSPFSPNGDGSVDSTALRWVGGDRSFRTLQVLSPSGTLLRTIQTNVAADAGTVSAAWDGKIGGVRAAPGTYRLRATIFGPDGRASVLQRDVVVQ